MDMQHFIFMHGHAAFILIFIFICLLMFMFMFKFMLTPTRACSVDMQCEDIDIKQGMQHGDMDMEHRH
jgi:hypothetical protein